MGSQDFYPEERPVRQKQVGGFWMDEHPVTVAEFRRFVKDTGHLTTAEQVPVADDFPGADPATLVPGSLVFTMTSWPVDLDDWRRWWAYVPDAQWRRPTGPASTLDGRQHHPVTHVSYADALSYADWSGKSLPTEAEWEFAARGGLEGAVFPWGDEFMPNHRRMANTWHGRFPWEYEAGRKHEQSPGTTPVRSYPPNGYGLYDMVGNVWEWTADHYRDSHDAPVRSCCAPQTPPHDTAAMRYRVTKGGSHLCAPNYCFRYRPAARQRQSEDTSTCHLGFRCVIR